MKNGDTITIHPLPFFFSHFMHFANNGNKFSAKMYLNGIVLWWKKYYSVWTVLSLQFQHIAREFLVTSIFSISLASTYYPCVFCIWRQSVEHWMALSIFECHICESKFSLRCCRCVPSSFSDDGHSHCWELDTESYHSLSISGSWPKKNRLHLRRM